MAEWWGRVVDERAGAMGGRSGGQGGGGGEGSSEHQTGGEGVEVVERERGIGNLCLEAGRRDNEEVGVGSRERILHKGQTEAGN